MDFIVDCLITNEVKCNPGNMLLTTSTWTPFSFLLRKKGGITKERGNPGKKVICIIISI